MASGMQTPTHYISKNSTVSYSLANFTGQSNPPHIAFGFFVTMNPRPAIGRNELP